MPEIDLTKFRKVTPDHVKQVACELAQGDMDTALQMLVDLYSRGYKIVKLEANEQ